VSAATQFARIVSLVAELTRAERAGEDPASLAELATRHGVSERDIAGDIRTLTSLGNHADSDWLLSLSVALQRDTVSISSGGPFRRPVRLSPEERFALHVALVLQPDGAPLASRLAALWAGRSTTAPASDTDTESTTSLLARAAAEGREVVMDYVRDGEREPRARRIEPHQVAQARGHTYVVGYDVVANAWRHYRLDRVLSVQATGRAFARRADFTPVEEPDDLFRTTEPLDVVTVRFAAVAAHWVTEHYAEHEVAADGSVLVRFHTASPAWLVRTVLEHGGEAEVLDPPEYREAVRAAVA
jgi:predicted DNA-binding transcriptional regulator YafY